MKKLIFTFYVLLLCNSMYAQDSLNFDFEILKEKEAVGWSSFGNKEYNIVYDTAISQNGVTSASIEGNGNTDEFRVLTYTIPADFGGKKIKLTGYLKTENIVNGWAGLWMRIDPDISIDNMESRKVQGTTDWKKHEVELKTNNNATSISFGGLIVGTGKIWVDNFKITVDGKPLDQAPEKELDKEFDKGSKITIDLSQKNQIENLTLLGRIWGFLKYYHPEVGKGNFNWDYELFRILPDYQKAKSNTDRDKILSNWIDNLGTVKICKKCKPLDENAVLKPNLSWITDGNLSKDLINKLQFITQNRHQGNHYYIDMVRGVGNPEFKNENPYANMPYPDDGFRLLSVYKYWNMINYFFPYKHIMDKDWNESLKENIPPFINAKNELEYELAALKMIADIKDTHANLWRGKDKINEILGDNYPNFHVSFIENKLVIDNFYNEDSPRNGLKIGDIITRINGKKVEDIVTDNQDFYPASNQPTRLRDISFNLLRTTSNSLDIEVEDNGIKLIKTIPVYNKKDIKDFYKWYTKEENISSYRLLKNNIGYVSLKNIKDEDVNKIKKELKNTKGIIVDIRNYPSAFMPFTLGSFFTSSKTPFVKFTTGNIDYPGEFTFGDNLYIPSKGKTYQGKVIVLVNEISQSAAEYTAMAFRAGDNVSIIGSTTAGADGNVSTIYLPGGLKTMISGIGVYYPDGTPTQRVGIVPDIEVKPTIKGLIEERDELIEKAIEIIDDAKIAPINAKD
ncbi:MULTISPECIES: S41 family peptidase [unclassified Olleya]|uniref:S41 family peptidase n=1 Tax=unclassified Olleya TaxID=2615019 RepID=UPI0011A5E21B|nr:S41 family peptidase [Olleya sp. Hel_I_94]TVZ48027.1 peptidase S41-like protein [Olleya sp. Hel_I_94]